MDHGTLLAHIKRQAIQNNKYWQIRPAVLHVTNNIHCENNSWEKRINQQLAAVEW